MQNVIDSWKNKNVFEKQLILNLKELSDKSLYPRHWGIFILFLKKIKPNSILDVGCGCGSFYELCNREFSGVSYTGIDYSIEAISLAKSHWNYDNFFVLDYKDLTSEYISNFDLIHLGAMLDVLPNGDEALDFILSLKPKNLIISRMKLTNKKSYYDVYVAYNEIKTCAYYHNEDNFKNLCIKYGYKIDNLENNFYLKKI